MSCHTVVGTTRASQQCGQILEKPRYTVYKVPLLLSSAIMFFIYGLQASKSTQLKSTIKSFPYLNVKVFCKEALIIFIHAELNFCFQAIVTNFSLLYTRQGFLKK